MIPVGAFLAFYLLALLHCRYTYVRDPTSFFFDPDAGYAPRYSAVRQEAADAFVDAVTRDGEGSRSHHALGKKNLCVGMASVARDNARYFRTAVGSLLEGLSDEERGEIHLILFIAQTDPTVHPAYWESWLSALADQVLLYNQTLTDEEMQHIKQLEIEQGLFREKALFDYTYLLKACSKVDAPYIAILEDDVLAMGGWYHRTMTALETAESKTRQMGAMSCRCSLPLPLVGCLLTVPHQFCTYASFTRKNSLAGTARTGRPTSSGRCSLSSSPPRHF